MCSIRQIKPQRAKQPLVIQWGKSDKSRENWQQSRARSPISTNPTAQPSEHDKWWRRRHKNKRHGGNFVGLVGSAAKWSRAAALHPHKGVFRRLIGPMVKTASEPKHCSDQNRSTIAFRQETPGDLIMRHCINIDWRYLNTTSNNQLIWYYHSIIMNINICCLLKIVDSWETMPYVLLKSTLSLFVFIKITIKLVENLRFNATH